MAVTIPSTELSTGTTPRSASPVRTAVSTAPIDGYGTACTGPLARVSGRLATAASVNVPSGPR